MERLIAVDGAFSVSATTRSATSGLKGGMRDGRVLSRKKAIDAFFYQGSLIKTHRDGFPIAGPADNFISGGSAGGLSSSVARASRCPHRHSPRSLSKTLGSRLYGSLSMQLGIRRW